MKTSFPTCELAEAALDDAAAVQGRAFLDDPAVEFWFPDETSRRERLPWLMRVGLGLGLRFGHVHTTPDRMLGHAVWLPPGGTHVDEARLGDAGFVDPAAHMGDGPLERFGVFMEQLGAAHERLVPERHWYLLILGVDPPDQGRGVGSTLIRQTLARADAEGLRAYLETAKERNLSFYRAHGFEVVDEQVIVGGGPRVWLMVREPR